MEGFVEVYCTHDLMVQDRIQSPERRRLHLFDSRSMEPCLDHYVLNETVDPWAQCDANRASKAA
jgi:hypothetical protein